MILASCQVNQTQEESPHQATQRLPVKSAETAHKFQAAPRDELTSEHTITYLSLWERIRASFALQPAYSHPRVAEQTTRYAGNQEYFDLIAERAAPFLHGIVSEVESRGLPMEIALLPFIESAFSSDARSREGAVGLWQFMPGTARAYGLHQDWWYDGRRDPRASTTAALDYLQSLSNEFDQDWLIALAAYNTGSRNIRRALRRGGVQIEEADFWKLPLNAETSAHVPRLLALASVIAKPEAFSIELAELSNSEPLSYVDIGHQIELEQVASLTDLELGCIQTLNPGYLRWATHPEYPQQIAVPRDRRTLLENGLAELQSNRFVTWEHYAIQAGDTLSQIAQQLGTSTETLRAINNLQGSRIIAGQSLLIPRGSALLNLEALRNRRPFYERRQQLDLPESYTVRRGDNLWSIARRFDLRSADIAANNDLELNSLLQPGQTLDLQFARNATADRPLTAPSSDLYRVRPGDSLSQIAHRFKLDTADLLRWNGLTNNDLIYPGQELIISPR
ncbi:MAG: LysM peptidoglycan-binding domain-containing protein [Pseudomonadota bacterium]|nr:LysM peptidoglycan-binding domain-containing protein [Pseudomonadota bacterium]